MITRQPTDAPSVTSYQFLPITDGLASEETIHECLEFLAHHERGHHLLSRRMWTVVQQCRYEGPPSTVFGQCQETFQPPFWPGMSCAVASASAPLCIANPVLAALASGVMSCISNKLFAWASLVRASQHADAKDSLQNVHAEVQDLYVSHFAATVLLEPTKYRDAALSIIGREESLRSQLIDDFDEEACKGLDELLIACKFISGRINEKILARFPLLHNYFLTYERRHDKHQDRSSRHTGT